MPRTGGSQLETAGRSYPSQTWALFIDLTLPHFSTMAESISVPSLAPAPARCRGQVRACAPTIISGRIPQRSAAYSFAIARFPNRVGPL